MWPGGITKQRWLLHKLNFPPPLSGKTSSALILADNCPRGQAPPGEAGGYTQQVPISDEPLVKGKADLGTQNAHHGRPACRHAGAASRSTCEGQK